MIAISFAYVVGLSTVLTRRAQSVAGSLPSVGGYSSCMVKK